MKILRIVILILMLSMLLSLVCFADWKSTSAKVDEIGNIILQIVWKMTYWGVAIKGIYNLYQAGNKHDKKGIVEAVTFYGSLFAAIRYFPELLKMIGEMF
jgi:hypothetical protein